MAEKKEKKENVIDCSNGYYSIAMYYKAPNVEHVDSYRPKDDNDMHEYLRNVIGHFLSNYCVSDNSSLLKKMEDLKLFSGSPLAASFDKVSIEYSSGTVKYWSVMFDNYISINGCPGTEEAAYMLVHIEWNRT